MTWHIIGILAFVVIYNIWHYYHEDDNYADCPVNTRYQVPKNAGV